MKTYDIDVLRLKSLRHDRGLIEIGIDAQVALRPARESDRDSDSSRLQLPVDQARSLLLLLKQQLAELDKQLPRSRRSGRC